MDFWVETKQDLEDAVQEFGFLPYFENSIPGFSLEEHCSRQTLFGELDGNDTWSWKGPVIQDIHCAYGKFFEKKAAYVSKEWFLDFANYRRNGYDFEGFFNDEWTSFRDKALYDTVDEHGPALSYEVKKAGGYGGKDGKKGFDTILARLQMQCFLVTTDFVYRKDKFGNTYGWGVAEYATVEQYYGDWFSQNAYKREPEESYERLFEHFRKILPDASEKQIGKMLS